MASPAEPITNDAVRQALTALRYGKSLRACALLGANFVAAGLRADSLPDTPQTRAWVLGNEIQDAITGELGRLRGSGSRPPGDAATPTDSLADLQRDFATGATQLQALSALHERYLAVAGHPVANMAAAAGVHERTFERRVNSGVELLRQLLLHRELTARRGGASAAGVRLDERILMEENEPVPDCDELVRAVRAAVLDERRVVRAPTQALQAFEALPVTDLGAYRVGRILEWARPRYRVEDRFVRLTLLVDQGEGAAARWFEERTFKELRAILEAVPDQALVLLGPPGCGKSTLLRRLEFDLSAEWLRHPSERVSLFAPLNSYRAKGPGLPPPPPLEWLADGWRARYPRLPSFEKLVAQGRLVLLLDGLNEMPHRDYQHYRDLVMAWKGALQRVAAAHPKNLLLFSCRSLDYSAPLSTPALRVPQVRIEAMDDEQVHEFLRLYSPKLGEAIWEVLRRTHQLDLLRVPFFSRLLVEQVEAEDRIPVGAAALFTGFVRQALRREIERDVSYFAPGHLLSPRDCRRVVQGRGWRTPYDLPDEGPLVPALQHLAHGMQSRESATGGAQVRIPASEAQAMAEAGCRELIAGADLLAAGTALAVLDEDQGTGEILFFHQLLQEYFAARAVASGTPPPALRAEWRADRVEPPLRETLAELDAAAPLPPLPQSGWEETTVLSASMAPDAASFLHRLAGDNLVLAARCAAEPDVHPRLPSRLLDEIRQALASRAEDRGADLRVRIQAALQLGRLGDPRLRESSGPDGAFKLAPLVRVPAGEYPIGADGAPAGEAPLHHVDLAAFDIGRYPVTNAEWAAFIQAGGYEDRRWWPPGPALDWQAGAGTGRGGRDDYRMWRQRLLDDPTLLDEHYRHGRVPERLYHEWLRRLRMTDDEFEEHLREKWPDGPKVVPERWFDRDYSNPSQPVTGVSWFEARAYCLWLSAQAERTYRLPTEVEWEAAARGPEGRTYAWGDEFDALRCNMAATHIRRPTPVGVFVEGDTADGVADLTGNVVEWTGSLFGRMAQEFTFGYPYDATDGREDVAGDVGAMLLVQRGGAWPHAEGLMRASARFAAAPTMRGTNAGLRVLRSID